MKKLAVLLSILLAGCAVQGQVISHNVSPQQNFRLTGQDKAIEFTGSIEKIVAGQGLSQGWYHEIKVFIDGELALKGKLDVNYFGDVNGEWHGKKTAANCTSKLVSENWLNTSCIVFLENERTVTLTF